MEPPKSSWQGRRVGNVEVIALVDNLSTYPAAVVYPTAGDALNRFSGYMDSDGGLALNFAAFLVRDGQTSVLVDTGWGPELDGRLMKQRQARRPVQFPCEHPGSWS